MQKANQTYKLDNIIIIKSLPMKKIIFCIAMIVVFFACSKTEAPSYEDMEQGTNPAMKAKPGGGGGGGPTITTTYFSPDITTTSATAGGIISKSGGGSNTTERGVCYNLTGTPTISDNKVTSGSGWGEFTCSLTGLEENTTYYARAYASIGTTTYYGNQISFTTLLVIPNYGTVQDYEGNTYNTILIGSQEWMLENLRTTHYSNGAEVPNVSDNTAWYNLMYTHSGAYCNYNNDASNVAVYGRLYNWYAAADTRNLAPVGWHVPTRADWDELEYYLGRNSGLTQVNYIGRKLKELGNAHWGWSNPADNASGFTALPGGTRDSYGTFSGMGYYGWFLSSSTIPASGQDHAYWRSLNGADENIYWVTQPYNAWGKSNGLSIRCVKNDP